MNAAIAIANGCPDPTTAQRFEAKYLIPEMKARAIAAFILPFVRPDRHTDETMGYIINSVYLDSPDLFLYRSSACGERNRFKLRFRTYGYKGNGHVFFEIKRRLNQVIRKERVSIQTARVDDIVKRRDLSPEETAILNRDGVEALRHFIELQKRLDATPKVCIIYSREAYVSAFDEPARITFDRNIQCYPIHNGAVPALLPVIEAGVVLEIKFTDHAPVWIRQLVQRFDLQCQSVSKYVLAVDSLKRCRIPLAAGREVTPL